MGKQILAGVPGGYRGSRGTLADPGMVTKDSAPHSRRTTSDSDGEAAGLARATAHDGAGPLAPGDHGSSGPAVPSGAVPPVENEQSRIDADLEASVLDSLTDGVLTGPSHSLLTLLLLSLSLLVTSSSLTFPSSSLPPP